MIHKIVVRVPLKQFERLELLVKYPRYTADGTHLLDNGYDCLESPHFVFIHAKEPPMDEPEYWHWIKTFKGRQIIDGKIINRKGRRFVCMPLRP